MAAQDPSRIPGPPQRPQKGSQRLQKGLISCSGRCRNNNRARTFRQKPTSKQTSEHISRAEDPPNSILARRNARSVSIRHIQRIHGVYEGMRSSTGSLGRFTSPYPSAGFAHAAGLTQRMLLERAGSNSGKPENHRFRYYTSAIAI